MIILEKNNQVFMQEECGSSHREIEIMMHVFRIHIKSFLQTDTWQIILQVRSKI